MPISNRLFIFFSFKLAVRRILCHCFGKHHCFCGYIFECRLWWVCVIACEQNKSIELKLHVESMKLIMKFGYSYQFFSRRHENSSFWETHEWVSLWATIESLRMMNWARRKRNRETENKEILFTFCWSIGIEQSLLLIWSFIFRIVLFFVERCLWKQ